MHCMFQLPKSKFQSTLPRRERRGASNILPFISSISIHAPAEGATCTSMLPVHEYGISIHAPAEGATSGTSFIGTASVISIHAPAEGATTPPHSLFDNRIISIHAPAEGATSKLEICSLLIQNFNPRSRGGSDSTGTSTRPFAVHFNPRSRGGSDSKHTQFFRSNFRTKCAYLYFLLHYIFFTQNKQSYK